jgi:hypothetical protein
VPIERFRRIIQVLTILAILLPSQSSTADVGSSTLFRKANTSEWIVSTPVDPTVQFNVVESSEGFYTLLDEQRIRLGRKEVERYVRRVRKIVSIAGVESLAEVLIEIEPAYQQLVLHAVGIHRAGLLIDALPMASTRLVEEEPEFERHVYQGTITAHIIL